MCSSKLPEINPEKKVFSLVLPLSAGPCSLPFPLRPQLLGVTTTEASITRARWGKEAGSSITPRDQAAWIGSCLLRRSEDSGGLFEITMQSRPHCQVFNDTQIQLRAYSQRSLSNFTVDKQSKLSINLVPSFLKHLCTSCDVCVNCLQHKSVLTSHKLC